MPENENREAYEISDLIHSAAGIAEQAIKTTDEASKNALKAAAKALLQNAIARMDESVAAEEDE